MTLRNRGRPIAHRTWMRAAIAVQLIEKHGAYIKDAVRATASTSYHDQVERAVRKLRARKSPNRYYVGPHLVEKYAAALPERRRKGPTKL